MSRDTYTKEAAWSTELRSIAMKAAERLVTLASQHIPSYQQAPMAHKKEFARVAAGVLIEAMSAAGVHLAAGGGARIIGGVKTITLDGEKSKVVVQVRPGTTPDEMAKLAGKHVAVVYTDVGTFDGVRQELEEAVRAMQLDFVTPEDPDKARLANAVHGSGSAAGVKVAASASGQVNAAPPTPPEEAPPPGYDTGGVLVNRDTGEKTLLRSAREIDAELAAKSEGKPLAEIGPKTRAEIEKHTARRGARKPSGH